MTQHYSQLGINEQQSSSHNIVPFDPYNWESFFFGPLNRDDAEGFLKGTEVGTFLLRESTSVQGYSLSVKENNERVNHYLIDREEQEGGKQRFSISNVNFVDIPSILNHYKLRKLDTTPLIYPLGRPTIEKVIGRFKFEGERISDLPFDRGEILEVLSKPEERWWMARNCLGNTGLIPTNYVKIYEEGDEISLQNPSSKSIGSSSGSSGKRFSSNSVESNNNINNEQQNNKEYIELSEIRIIRTLLKLSQIRILSPNSWVRVIADRWPSIYDLAALSIKQGQHLWVQELLPNGMCRGANEDGKAGLFPITYVEPLGGLMPEAAMPAIDHSSNHF
ncbi:hypothetical protein Mgra_00004803 [Meloidogyne graminicola]|uniref:Uncharacterized protein n=1 Tax=Meloidogyne graminicola TaxID=189291 RepID=A0A8S9ZQK0_9BILA|nr:hypothetical protein Mgra_00004803 [Meloidogyne graminicola]